MKDVKLRATDALKSGVRINVEGRDDVVNSFEYTAITFDSKTERNIINRLISECTVTYRVSHKSTLIYRVSHKSTVIYRMSHKSVIAEQTDESGSHSQDMFNVLSFMTDTQVQTMYPVSCRIKNVVRSDGASWVGYGLP
jgi:hypothetical protein